MVRDCGWSQGAEGGPILTDSDVENSVLQQQRIKFFSHLSWSRGPQTLQKSGALCIL